MNIERRKWIVEHSSHCTLEGSKTSVAGYGNEDHAGLAPGFGGFWAVDWKTAERVVLGDGKFYARDVRFISWRWLGYGEPVPEPLKVYETW